MQVANQPAPVPASPHTRQSLPDLAKTHETETHTPFSVILGEHVRTETAQAHVPASSRVSGDPQEETGEAAAGLDGEIPQASDLPVGRPQKLQPPLPAAEALPNALSRPVQDSAERPVASSGEKPLPDSPLPSIEGKEKALSSDHRVSAGPAQQRSKEKHEDSGINGRGTAPVASGNLSIAHVTVAEINMGPVIPANLLAENAGSSLPAEAPAPIGHAPVTPGTVPSTNTAGATSVGDTGVRTDEKNSDVSSNGNPGPDLAAAGAVTSEPLLPNSKPVASSSSDVSPLQHPQGDNPLRAEDKRPPSADRDSSPSSSTQAAESDKLPASLPANALQHGAPAQVGASAQVAGMALNGKHHDVVPVSSANGVQTSTATGSPSPSAGMQGGENAAKPTVPPNVAANPFAKLDLDPNADAIVLHSSAQQIAVGVPHPSLGWVEINTQSAGDRIAATLVSASTQTHQHLTEQLPSLTQYLADREVKVSSVAVHQETAGSDGGGSGNAHNSQARDGGGSSRPKLQVDSAKPLQGDGRNEMREGQRLSYIDIHA